MKTRPVSTVAGLMERALEAAGKSQHAEAVLVGLGTAALCALLAYALVALFKLQLGILAIVLG
jgi:hypothetical protein